MGSTFPLFSLSQKNCTHVPLSILYGFCFPPLQGELVTTRGEETAGFIETFTMEPHGGEAVCQTAAKRKGGSILLRFAKIGKIGFLYYARYLLLIN